MDNCIICDKLISINAKACPHCGEPNPTSKREGSKKENGKKLQIFILTIVLALAGGWFAMHQFSYLFDIAHDIGKPQSESANAPEHDPSKIDMSFNDTVIKNAIGDTSGFDEILASMSIEVIFGILFGIVIIGSVILQSMKRGIKKELLRVVFSLFVLFIGIKIISIHGLGQLSNTIKNLTILQPK